MQTCAETLNWGPDHPLWSLEDPSRMGTTWQFPVWIIMFCFLNVSHALSISMVIISTLRPTLKCKRRYTLLNSCCAPPQEPLFARSDARVGTRKVKDSSGGVRAAPSLQAISEILWDEKSKTCRSHFKEKRNKYTSVERRRESLSAVK